MLLQAGSCCYRLNHAGPRWFHTDHTEIGWNQAKFRDSGTFVLYGAPYKLAYIIALTSDRTLEYIALMISPRAEFPLGDG